MAEPRVFGRQTLINSLWNFAGYVLPMIVGLVAIPKLLQDLGEARFGLLALVWMGVGYFSFFDIGLSRALTKLVSQRIGEGNEEEIGGLFWTALLLALAAGTTGGLLVWASADYLVNSVFSIPDYLIEEAARSFKVLAAGLPVVVVSAITIGQLEARHQFRDIMSVRVPLGLSTFIVPLLVAHYSPDIGLITFALLVARLLAMLGFAFHLRHRQRQTLGSMDVSLASAGALARFGGWISVSAIVGPIMVYFDRFIVGGTLSLEALSKYVAPYEAANRIQLVPQSIVSAAFPSLAASIAGAVGAARDAIYATNRLVLAGVLPICGVLVIFGPEIIELWLGASFAGESGRVLQILSLGWLINSLARVPSSVLQAAGKPDKVAKLHLAEVVPYLYVLYLMTSEYGIIGTALAWTGRIVIDAIAVAAICDFSISHIVSLARATAITVLAICVASATVIVVDSFVLDILALVVVLAVSVMNGTRALRGSGLKADLPT